MKARYQARLKAVSIATFGMLTAATILACSIEVDDSHYTSSNTCNNGNGYCQQIYKSPPDQTCSDPEDTYDATTDCTSAGVAPAQWICIVCLCNGNSCDGNWGSRSGYPASTTCTLVSETPDPECTGEPTD